MEHSEAASILYDCVETDAGAVWNALLPFLTEPGDAHLFVVGFPTGLLSQMPPHAVIDWIGAAPQTRAAIVARMVSKDLASDEALGARVLGAFGDLPHVGDAFFSAFVSGSWTGPASGNWARLAGQLEDLGRRTLLPNLKRWAERSSRRLREMAERDLEREAEESVLRR